MQSYITPGAFVTAEGDPAVYRVTEIVDRGGPNLTSIKLEDIVTGDPGWAPPYELSPVDEEPWMTQAVEAGVSARGAARQGPDTEAQEARRIAALGQPTPPSAALTGHVPHAQQATAPTAARLVPRVTAEQGQER